MKTKFLCSVPESIPVLPLQIGNAGQGQRQTRIAQLHIVDSRNPVQVHHARVIQPHPIVVFSQPLAVDQACVCFHRHFFSGNAQIISKPADAPASVAAHLPPGTIRIIKMQAKIRLLGTVQHHKAVCPGHRAQGLRRVGIVDLYIPAIQHHKVVASAVHI